MCEMWQANVIAPRRRQRTARKGVMQMEKTVWIGLVDALATTIVLLAGRFISPGDVELVKALVVAWQPIAAAVVLAVAYREGLLVKERIAQWEVKLAQIKEAK